MAVEALEASEVAEATEVNEAAEGFKAWKITIEDLKAILVLELNNMRTEIISFSFLAELWKFMFKFPNFKNIHLPSNKI